MKYFNRYGDFRSIFFKKDDNLKIRENYYKIHATRVMPERYIDLGPIAAGSMSAPAEGTLVELENLRFDKDNILAQTIPAVYSSYIWVEIFLGKKTGAFLDINRKISGTIGPTSPVEDPHILYQLTWMKGTYFSVKGWNTKTSVDESWLVLTPIVYYKLEPLPEAPSIYATVELTEDRAVFEL